MDGVVEKFLSGAKSGDLESVRLCLHPYLVWISSEGHTTRGRSQVLEMLEASPVDAEPAGYQLRDGQIYRWQESRQV